MSLIWTNIMKTMAIKKVSSSRLSLQSLNKAKLTDEFIKRTLYDTVECCRTSLEFLLSEKEFFISNKPDSIHITIHGECLLYLVEYWNRNGKSKHFCSWNDCQIWNKLIYGSSSSWH